MKCPMCGKDSPEDALFCLECGASLSASPVTGEIPQDMDSAVQEGVHSLVIPDDAIVVRQSKWAYLLAAVPWFVLFGVSFVFDFFSFGILPVVFAGYFIGHRYLSWRRTVYVVTDLYLIIQQGSLMGHNRIELSFDDLVGVMIRPGMFGRFLGYTHVSLQLKDERRIVLRYVPLASPLLDHQPLVAVWKITQ